MKKKACAVLACLLLLMAACGEVPSSSEAGAGGSTKRNPVASDELQFQYPTEGCLVALFETTKGNFQVVLFPDYAPQAVENFRLLVEGGFYARTEFHRVLPEFVIQGGLGDGGSQSAWGNTFPPEITDKLHHYTGALCMVPDENGMHGSQFYIVAAPQTSVPEEMQQTLRGAGVREAVVNAYAQAGGAPYLDNTATVFGQVYSGMDVVDSICATNTDDAQRPKTAIVVTAITVYDFTQEAAQP